jgi:hypothetical protein
VDHRSFDALAKSFSSPASRRSAVAALFAALGLGARDADAKPEDEGKTGGRPGGKAHGRNRGNGHGNGRNRKGKRCDPKPDAEVCDGKCGDQTNNCGQRVRCPECTCASACGACKTCDEAIDECVPADEGEACDVGDLCTVGTTCQGGVCGGGSPACVNSGICDPQTGACDCTDATACPTNTVRDQIDCSCRCPEEGFVVIDGACFRQFPTNSDCQDSACVCSCLNDDNLCASGASWACASSAGCPNAGEVCVANSGTGRCVRPIACPA